MDVIQRYKLLLALLSIGFIGNLIVVYYLIKGFSYGQIGIATSLGVLGAFLFEVPTGIVGDRVSRKLSVLVGFSIHALSTVVLILLSNFPMLLLYSLLAALGAAFVSGSLQAWLFDNLRHLKKEKEYRRIMKDAKSITIPLSAVTLITGAFLAQFYGFILPLFLSLVVELSAVVLVATIPEYDFQRIDKGYLTHALGSFRELVKPRLFWLISLSIVVSLQTNQFRKFFEPYLGEVLSSYLGTTLIGTLSLLGVVEVTVRTLPRLVGVRLPDSWSLRLYLLAPLVLPILTVLSAIYTNPIWLVLLGITLTVISTAFGFNISVELQHRIPSEARATILSLDRMVAAVIMASFYALYGFAVDALGLKEARLVFALILLGTGVAFKLAESFKLSEHLQLTHLKAEVGEE
ncbi:MFS transporter [Thermococcus sp.]|uniref:MFS transporter n=1 Tax=Thermococcus sp. TaxID=35749 RepID=UPI0026071211|nr:MFS transporter [Thermococcus sp.]